MPRPVVPMAFAPRARSRAWSSMTCEGRIRGQSGEIRSRSNTGTPRSISIPLSVSSASSESTTPLPMKQRTCSRRMPAGMSERIVLRPPITRVWPALWPPWKRATAAARSVRRSTTLPLPSSPHWVPMTTTNLPMPAYRAMKRMITPMSMEPRPAMRNSRSRTSTSRASARFTPCGLMNGAIPSNTRNRPNAAARSGRFTPRASLGSPALVRVLQVLEELPVGSQHQQVPVPAESALVGLETAVEGVELGILRVGARVNLRGRRVALAADVERIALGVGENLGAAPLGGRLDAGAGALPFGAQPPGGAGEALLHALEDARGDVIRQVDPLHAHVDQLDAETLEIG